jgi:hypothetical protein
VNGAHGGLLTDSLTKDGNNATYKCSDTGGGVDPNKINGVGTNCGLLVNVLPGPNKGFLCKLMPFLS